jgi:hypothetical protein
MKTQKEIEQLSEQRFPTDNSDRFKNVDFSSLKIGFFEGYTQAQEDMVEKYTEQDMIKFAFDTYYQEDMAKKYTEEDIINIVKKSRETGLTAEYLILQLNK